MRKTLFYYFTLRHVNVRGKEEDMMEMVVHPGNPSSPKNRMN